MIRRALVLAVAAAAALVSLPTRAADDLGVELVKSVAAPIARGQRGTVSLTLLPRAGNRLLDDGPLLVHVSGDGLAPERALYRRDEAVDPRAEAPRFELPFRALAPGTAELHARCTFYVCRGARCRPVETEAAWSVTVTAAP